MKLPLWFRDYCERLTSRHQSSYIAQRVSAVILAVVLSSTAAYFFGVPEALGYLVKYFVIFCAWIVGSFAVITAYEIVAGLVDELIYRVGNARRAELQPEEGVPE